MTEQQKVYSLTCPICNKKTINSLSKSQAEHNLEIHIKACRKKSEVKK